MFAGKNKQLIHLFACILLFYPVFSSAGYFDCSVIYDEFDSLMNKQYLIEPDRYVQVQKGRMSRAEFFSLQQGRLRLNADRQGYGVAIIRTNQNIRGKFLFNWNVEKINGEPPLMIQESVMYGRIYNGYAPQRLRPTMIKPTYFIDIDTGAVTEESKDADIAYRFEEGIYYLEAINGAELSFPVETLCHVIKNDVAPLQNKNVNTNRIDSVLPNNAPATTFTEVPDLKPKPRKKPKTKPINSNVIPGLRSKSSDQTLP